MMITVDGLKPKPYYVTPEGAEELQRRLAEVRSQRQKLVDEMRDDTTQSSDGGSFEDSSRMLTQNRILELESHIVLLERIIALAKVIKKPAASDRIQIGSQVSVAINDKPQTYVLVSSIEADPTEGKVSIESPLGQSLLGKQVNDSIELPARRTKLTATIIDIA